MKIRDLQKADEAANHCLWISSFCHLKQASLLGAHSQQPFDDSGTFGGAHCDVELMKQVNEVLENVRTEASIAPIACDNQEYRFVWNTESLRGGVIKAIGWYLSSIDFVSVAGIGEKLFDPSIWCRTR